MGMTRAAGDVVEVADWGAGAQEVRVRMAEEEIHRALNYPDLTGPAQAGDRVLLNTTAAALHLGTGGYDFVIANLTRPEAGQALPPGHIVKGRYLPCQQAVLTLEEQPRYACVWDCRLDGLPVLAGQLHSQIAPAAAGLALRGRTRVVSVTTDGGALPLAWSRLVPALKQAGLLLATITCGQAFGGDYETVTLHSALLAARHILDADAVLVCQGPGNAGTGTRYGFSGIEQAQNLDIAAALGGTPIAIVRCSSADRRARHQGVSHHTRTTLELAYAPCLVPLPRGMDPAWVPARHTVRFVDGAQAALDFLAGRSITVTTMGRAPDEDPAFFLAAAAAGLLEEGGMTR